MEKPPVGTLSSEAQFSFDCITLHRPIAPRHDICTFAIGVDLDARQEALNRAMRLQKSLG